ncbi:MAG: hypothetical protein CMN73_09615 [Sphingomonas sp.]|nr:hypothetical protein [Sphingomonas sp.]|tara:strand:+ start:1647 stop:1943 length:297 start_codon:yes stop_codon:yes gene_type:complete
MHGKVWLEFGPVGCGNGSDDAAGQVIQCAPEIVDGITNDESKQLWKVLMRNIPELSGGRVVLRNGIFHWMPAKIVPVGIQGFRTSPQFVNVAIGPLNL